MRTLANGHSGTLPVRVLAVTVFVVGMSFGPGWATAQVSGDPTAGASSEADAAIRAGTDLRRKGDDRAALLEFQRAVRLQETPRAFAQLGLAEQALGLWLDAHGHLGRALAGQDDPWIEKNRLTLQTARATIQSHLAEVEVWGTPKGAEIRFDGVLAGTLPSVTAWVATGEITMVVTAPGHAPLTRLLSIPAPTRSREHVQLRPSAASANGTTPVAVGEGTASARGLPPLPAPAGGATETSLLDASETATPAGTDITPAVGTPIYKRWWFWAGVSALAVGTGATIYLLTRDSASGGTTCAVPPCDRI